MHHICQLIYSVPEAQNTMTFQKTRRNVIEHNISLNTTTFQNTWYFTKHHTYFLSGPFVTWRHLSVFSLFLKELSAFPVAPFLKGQGVQFDPFFFFKLFFSFLFKNWIGLNVTFTAYAPSQLYRCADLWIDLNIISTGRWPNLKVVNLLSEPAMLLLPHSVFRLLLKFKGQRETVIRCGTETLL